MSSHEMSKNVTVAAAGSYLWPEDDSQELKSGRLGANNLHRFDIVEGSGTATVKYRTFAGQTLKTITPPTDWTTLETWIGSGVYQFEFSAATGAVTFDIKSYKEGV